MCLGVPGKIVSVEGEGTLRLGVVDFAGTKRQVSLAYVPEAVAGDWVVVHVGFALNTLDEDEARETLALFEEIAARSAAESGDEPPE